MLCVDFPSLLIQWPNFDKPRQASQRVHGLVDFNRGMFSSQPVLVAVAFVEQLMSWRLLFVSKCIGKSCLMRLSDQCLDAIFTKSVHYILFEFCHLH